MNIDELSINTIRILGNEAINKAKSGHPGMVLGASPIIYTLFTKFMNATPKDSQWINRDRFVLASGHASMLLYTTLHLCGYKISIEDLQNFRSLGSRTPGHPEFGHTDGVDCTSGPLGQGIGHAVGLAMAEAHLAKKFNKEEVDLINHYTYALCGDGDMQEGVTYEASSLAGKLKLNKLIVLYDCNNVTLDGPLTQSFDENVKKRFESLNWSVLEVEDGNNVQLIEKSIKKAKQNNISPTLIIIKTTIGFGSKNQGTCAVHGAPLGDEDLNQFKQRIEWNYQPFFVPTEVYQEYHSSFLNRGKKAYNSWKRKVKFYKENYEKEYDQFRMNISSQNPNIHWPTYELGYKEATRNTSNKIINSMSKTMSNLLGGASDVAKSVNTTIKNSSVFTSDDYSQQNIHYGIREFAMSCAQTGMLLHGGIRTFIGSFLVFADYFKASIRTAALMNQPAIYVLSHDSIAVGEDGPTHQPIEQIASLRLIPNTLLFRPANATETTYSWRYSIEQFSKPCAIILSRQDLVEECQPTYEQFCQGAYIAALEQNKVDYALIATGSELSLAIALKTRLMSEKGIDVRVISMPCTQLFNSLSSRNQKKILGTKKSNIIAIEMGSGDGWYRYASQVLSLDQFGASGKANDVIEYFGFTVDALFNKIRVK